MIFQINDCLIDTDAYEVRRNGTLVPVEPQVFDLLVLLLENRDRLVTKDEIIERIWHGRAISEAALNSRIKSVRQAIGDCGTTQALIRTIRGRGFRVVGEVNLYAAQTANGGEAATVPAASAAAPPVSEPPPRPGHSGAAGSSGGETRAALDEPSGSRPDVKTRAAGRLWRIDQARAGAFAIAIGVLVLASFGGWSLLRSDQTAPPPIANAALSMPAGPGIAVLRFSDASGDADARLLGDAIVEEIATHLTRFSELRVAVRTLTAEYDGAETDVGGIGRKLGVEFLVKGSLRPSLPTPTANSARSRRHAVR